MIQQLYECFRFWSEGGSVWIYADPHFDDEDCLKMDPHWPSSEEQVAKINAKVHKDDTLIILGDIGNKDYIPKLKAGHKVLIAGNHDVGLSNYKKKRISRVYDADDKNINEKILREETQKEFPNAKITIYETYEFHSPFNRYNVFIDNKMFNEVYGGPLFISDKIVLSHEPIDLPFALNIHGHCHSSLGYGFEHMNRFNVCSNTVNFEPINLGEIIKAGYLKRIDDIHRITIDEATKNKKEKEYDK